MRVRRVARKTAAGRLVKALLDMYGRTYCDELGIDIIKGTPSALFRWLCSSLLFSARISAGLASRAALALSEQGWNDPRKLRDAGWERRTRVLNEAGYARYDESTSRRLEDMAELLSNRYGGDLRRLREQADRDPEQERRLLLEFKGIGPVGVDIFCREAQACWEELYPFADRKSLGSAKRLGLPGVAAELARLVERKDFATLVAALVRVDLAKAHHEVTERASA